MEIKMYKNTWGPDNDFCSIAIVNPTGEVKSLTKSFAECRTVCGTEIIRIDRLVTSCDFSNPHNPSKESVCENNELISALSLMM